MVQLVYWLALSTWFGSALFIAIAFPIIFKTVREDNPILSHVLSVNLDGQHSTLLAGNIVYQLVQRFLSIELLCAAMVLVTLFIQPFIINLGESNLQILILRCVLFVTATAVVLYDWQVIWPRIRSSRQTYLDHADEPEVANPALDQFDTAQRKSMTMLTAVIVLLLGTILFSSNITPPAKQALQITAPVTPAAAK